MSAADNGGPAFPVLPPVGPDGTSAVGYPYVCGGMTLRDYFAAKAMQGLLSNPKLHGHILKTGGAYGGWIEASSYSWADAMLAERAK